jgi:hypothetical protein
VSKVSASPLLNGRLGNTCRPPLLSACKVSPALPSGRLPSVPWTVRPTSPCALRAPPPCLALPSSSSASAALRAWESPQRPLVALGTCPPPFSYICAFVGRAVVGKPLSSASCFILASPIALDSFSSRTRCLSVSSLMVMLRPPRWARKKGRTKYAEVVRQGTRVAARSLLFDPLCQPDAPQQCLHRCWCPPPPRVQHASRQYHQHHRCLCLQYCNIDNIAIAVHASRMSVPVVFAGSPGC